MVVPTHDLDRMFTADGGVDQLLSWGVRVQPWSSRRGLAMMVEPAATDTDRPSMLSQRDKIRRRDCLASASPRTASAPPWRLETKR